MPVKVRCPECESVAAIPDNLMGRKLKCSNCGNQFVASSPSGVKAAVPPPAGTTTVVAKRVGGRPVPPPPPVQAGGSIVWPVAAVFALLLPIAAAAGFAYLKWDRGSPVLPPETVVEGGGTDVAPPAARGELYGAIEVASKGVKYTCFEVYPEKEHGENYRRVVNDSTNTNIVQGMDKTGQFDPTGLNDSVTAAHKFYDVLTKTYNVPPDRVFVVGSSGLDGAVTKRPEQIAKNHQELGDAIRKALGKEMGFVSVEDEVRHQIEGVVPPRDLDSALMIDVGSGSTRGGYREGPGLVKIFEGPGLKKFHNTVAGEVKKRDGATFAKTTEELAEDKLRKPFHEQVERNAGLRAQDKVYLVGGIVWVMATYLHPEKCDAKHFYIGLDPGDFDRFIDKVRADPDCLASFAPPAGLDAESKKKLEEDIKRMRKNFGPEELLAGAEILKALSEELDFAKKKELAFYRTGDIAWVVDYVAGQAKFKK